MMPLVSLGGRWLGVLRVAFYTVVALGVVVALFGWLRFRAQSERILEVSGPIPALANDGVTVARGEHIARTLGGCAECHGNDFAGRVMDENALVRVAAPNITPAGAVREYTEGDWFRAIAHGVDRKGRSLLVMPSRELASLSDEDIGAIISFLRGVPAVERDVGRVEVRLVGKVVFGLTGAELMSAEGFDHERRPAVAPPRGPTRAYGEYLANVCRGCHGPKLEGGIVVHPGAPPSADISAAAMRRWSFREFERALREGKRRDGTALDAAMPWNAMRGLSDDEMRALWLGLRQE